MHWQLISINSLIFLRDPPIFSLPEYFARFTIRTRRRPCFICEEEEEEEQQLVNQRELLAWMGGLTIRWALPLPELVAGKGERMIVII